MLNNFYFKKLFFRYFRSTPNKIVPKKKKIKEKRKISVKNYVINFNPLYKPIIIIIIILFNVNYKLHLVKPEQCLEL